MNKKIVSHKKGFTLLELLVVLALIGIFASVVVAALSSSRGKGNDSAIRSGLNSLRTQSELFYLTNKKYGTNTTMVSVCSDSTTFIATTTGQGAGAAVTADLIKNAGGSANVSCSLPSGGTLWAVAARLNAGGYACVHGGDQTIIASTTGLLANAIVNHACVK